MLCHIKGELNLKGCGFTPSCGMDRYRTPHFLWHHQRHFLVRGGHGLGSGGVSDSNLALAPACCDCSLSRWHCHLVVSEGGTSPNHRPEYSPRVSKEVIVQVFPILLGFRFLLLLFLPSCSSYGGYTEGLPLPGWEGAKNIRGQLMQSSSCVFSFLSLSLSPLY